MSRKFLPIILAVVVLFVILRKTERNDLDDAKVINTDAWTAQAGRSKSAASADYALDVRRATWPPLEEGTASGNSGAQTTVNYYIVFDGSGSMLSAQCGAGSTKFDAALKAVRNFIAAAPAQANIGLTAFDRRAISERVPLAADNREALYTALKDLRAGSDTPLRSAIKIGYDKLTAQARAQLGYGEYHLVVVTDGAPDPDSEDPTPVVKEILAQSPIVVHTVGFCIDSQHVLNQPNKTFYASATSPEQLENSLQAVLAESTTFDATKFN